MRKHTSALLVVLLVAGVWAKIQHGKVDKDDRKLIPLTDAFGFGQNGYIVVTISNIDLFKRHDDSTQPDLKNLGLFLSSVDSDAALEEELLQDSNICILDSVESDKLLFNFKDSSVQKVVEKESKEFEYHMKVRVPGLYYLYFANCEANTPVSFDINVKMYNEDERGNKDYLSIGETELDTMLWVMFALFTGATAGWAYYVYKNKEFAHMIHHLMTALGVLRSLTVLSQALMYHYIERTGHADGWNIAYYIFTFFRGIMFFVVVILIGTGWSLWRPFLGDREKKVIMVVVPLQVLANIAIIVTEEEAPSTRDWFTWRDILHLVDIICCCAILFPIVWSIKNLREAAQTDGKAARNLEKLTLFRQFYVMVVVYIYFTRIVVYLLKSTMEYEYTWVAEAADQLATLAFYVWTAVKFRPHNDNPYLRVASNEDKEIEL